MARDLSDHDKRHDATFKSAHSRLSAETHREARLFRRGHPFQMQFALETVESPCNTETAYS